MCTAGKSGLSATCRTFCLFILFFPHLVAGPIVRARGLPAASPAAQALELGPRPHGARSVRAGHGQEDGDRRPDGPVCRPGVRRPRGVPHGGPLARGDRLHDSDLLRLLRVQRPGPGHGSPARLPAGVEFRSAVPLGERGRVLAALAHVLGQLAARLPVLSAGRQPRRAEADVAEFANCDGAVRLVARGRVDVHRIRLGSRPVPGNPRFLPGGVRTVRNWSRLCDPRQERRRGSHSVSPWSA